MAQQQYVSASVDYVDYVDYEPQLARKSLLTADDQKFSKNIETTSKILGAKMPKEASPINIRHKCTKFSPHGDMLPKFVHP